ncbi:hypothetical protein HDE_04474 [Halotydeus destructor]|nr:hypothetical protein HDE_04474 [Halotydeus destructor]
MSSITPICGHWRTKMADEPVSHETISNVALNPDLAAGVDLVAKTAEALVNGGQKVGEALGFEVSKTADGKAHVTETYPTFKL